MRNYKKEKTIKLVCDKCDSLIEGRWVATDRELYLSINPCTKCLDDSYQKGYDEGVADR